MNYSLKKTKSNVRLALLLGIMSILAFTPLGFITIPPVSITLLHIPVIIGAITMGVKGALFLGVSFGVLSMVKATIGSVSPIDILFSPFLSGSPIQSIILSVGTRVVFAISVYLIFKTLSKNHKINVKFSIGMSSLIGTIIHTILVLLALNVFFSAIPFKEVFLTLITFNGILENFVGVIVSVSVCNALLKMNI